MSVLFPLCLKCSSVGTKAGAQWPRQSPHPEQSACQSSVLHAPCPPRTPRRRPVISSCVTALRAFSSQCRLLLLKLSFPFFFFHMVSHMYFPGSVPLLASFPFQLMQPPWVMSSTWAPSAPGDSGDPRLSPSHAPDRWLAAFNTTQCTAHIPPPSLYCPAQVHQPLTLPWTELHLSPS